MVDGVTRNPERYLRKIEDIFGDSRSAILTRSYPKWTCFHVFVEDLISSVIYEDAETSGNSLGDLWVDHLIESNGMNRPDAFSSHFDRQETEDYLFALQQADIIPELCELISKQVFHVLFANRVTMHAFGSMVLGYVLEVSPMFDPGSLTESGCLFRSNIPGWAKSAIFHRDKGRCVLCKTDLTKLFSQQAQIHYDHIIPLALGGMNCVTNLQLTCSSCNLGKGARSSITSREYEVWYDY
jgi:hypothetical protein